MTSHSPGALNAQVRNALTEHSDCLCGYSFNPDIFILWQKIPAIWKSERCGPPASSDVTCFGVILLASDLAITFSIWDQVCVQFTAIYVTLFSLGYVCCPVFPVRLSFSLLCCKCRFNLCGYLCKTVILDFECTYMHLWESIALLQWKLHFWIVLMFKNGTLEMDNHSPLKFHV
jgi:hypothetical protein